MRVSARPVGSRLDLLFENPGGTLVRPEFEVDLQYRSASSFPDGFFLTAVGITAFSAGQSNVNGATEGTISISARLSDTFDTDATFFTVSTTIAEGGDFDITDIEVTRNETPIPVTLEGFPYAVPAPPGPGNDTLTGTEENDLLDGFGGNDSIEGLGGNDLLNGGDGADTLIGGPGDDRLIGGESAADLADAIFAGAGDDSIEGGAGNDNLNGGEGNDPIAGGAGADTVIGNAGDDVLTGGAFSDLIFGGDGFDFINGGFGSDRVNGGDGADRFFHVGAAGHGSDWIQDFSHTEGDRLVWGGGAASAAQFQVNIATTAGAGDAGTDEAFVIYRPTGQILWALVDGAGEEEINLALGGTLHDLLA